jgi:hypothetical protein
MTARTSIVGVERAWASPAALDAVCACGARSEHHRCARQPPQPNGGRPAPAADQLRSLVLGALRAHGGPMSGRAIARAVPRRAEDVRACLRELARDGTVRQGNGGWVAS